MDRGAAERAADGGRAPGRAPPEDDNKEAIEGKPSSVPLLSASRTGRSTNLVAIAVSTALPITGGWTMGMGLGNIGGIVESPIFKQTYDDPSPMMVQVLVGGLPLGAIIGSMFAGSLTDAFGRRIACMSCSLLMILGGLSLFLPCFTKVSLFVLFAGRFVVGLGTGIGYCAVYTVAAELSPADYRGRVQTLVQVFTAVGILTSYLINLAVFKTAPKLWCFSIAFQGVAALPMLGFAYFGPESPRWLVMTGQYTEAMSILRDILRTSKDDVVEEINSMTAQIRGKSACNFRFVNSDGTSVKRFESVNGRPSGEKKMAQKSIAEFSSDISEANSDLKVQEEPFNLIVNDTYDYEENDENVEDMEGTWRALCFRENRCMATVSIMLNVFQLLSGIDVVTIYAPKIFAGSSKGEDLSYNDSLFYTVIVGLAYVCATPLATLTVDCVGRRALLLLGATGMSLSMIGLSMGYASISFGPHMMLILVLLFVTTYSMSWGPIACAMASELVRTPIRAKVNAAGTVFNWVVSSPKHPSPLCIPSLSLLHPLTYGWLTTSWFQRT